jgi:hypothetical protein
MFLKRSQLLFVEAVRQENPWARHRILRFMDSEIGRRLETSDKTRHWGLASFGVAIPRSPTLP